MDSVDIAFVGSSLLHSIAAAKLSKQHGLKVLLTDPTSAYGGALFLPEDSVSGAKESLGKVDPLARPLLSTESLIEWIKELSLQDYYSFKSVPGICAVYTDEVSGQKLIRKVPIKKEDVFVDSSFSLLEKRKLMKTLSLLQEGEFDGSFSDFLESLELSTHLKELVLYSILQVLDPLQPLSFDQAKARGKQFLSSVGKYQVESPLLFSIFGISEIIGGFCRKAAVHGAQCMLKARLVDAVKESDGWILKFNNDSIWKSRQIFIDENEAKSVFPNHLIEQPTLQITCHVYFFEESSNPSLLSTRPFFVIVPPSASGLDVPIYMFMLPQEFFHLAHQNTLFVYYKGDLAEDLVEKVLEFSGVMVFTLVNTRTFSFGEPRVSSKADLSNMYITNELNLFETNMDQVVNSLLKKCLDVPSLEL